MSEARFDSLNFAWYWHSEYFQFFLITDLTQESCCVGRPFYERQSLLRSSTLNLQSYEVLYTINTAVRCQDIQAAILVGTTTIETCVGLAAGKLGRLGRDTFYGHCEILCFPAESSQFENAWLSKGVISVSSIFPAFP